MKNLSQIILASGSPRRIEIMEKHGIMPTVIPANIDERIPEGLSMGESVMFLALKKALYVESILEDSEKNEKPYIIAADTIVYKDGIIGKPKDRQEAYEILQRLRNSCHQVVTGVCIIKAESDIRHAFYEVTDVSVKNFTDEELNEYLDTDEPYDKAGAYAIQGIFSKYIEKYEGDFENVVGFPWKRIEEEFKEHCL